MKKAFTLVELLVVIAIIGMLAGLMLPAVQAAREAGRRAQCTNNQRNVALALINRMESSQSFPGYKQRIANDAYVGWYVALFPFLEQAQLYDSICGTDSTDNTIWTTSVAGLNGAYAGNYSRLDIKILVCPSSGLGGGRVSYVANCGPANVNEGNTLRTTATTGGTGGTVRDYEPLNKDLTVFANNSGAYKTSGSTDLNVYGKDYKMSNDYISTHGGTSHTLMTAENNNAAYWCDNAEWKVGFCFPFVAAAVDENNNSLYAGTDRPWNYYWNGKTNVNQADDASAVYPAKINAYVGSYNDGNSVDGYYTSTVAGAYQAYSKARPSSSHPGIVVAFNCDGSVRILNDDIENDTLYLLMIPAKKTISN